MVITQLSANRVGEMVVNGAGDGLFCFFPAREGIVWEGGHLGGGGVSRM